jgi:hypothetical protein
MNEKIEFEIDEEKARIKSAAVRWGVHSKSIKAYLEKGDEVGKDPPLWAEDPEDFLSGIGSSTVGSPRKRCGRGRRFCAAMRG